MSLVDFIDNAYHYENDLLNLNHVIGGTVAYVLGIKLIQYAMKDRKEFDLKWLMAYHNLFLCILSAVMASGTLFGAIQFLQDHGPWELYCAVHPLSNPSVDYSGRLWFWSWLFYASKYYEYLDTVFIVLRKRELSTLHFYHHMVIVPLCYLFLHYKVIGFWHGVVWNGTIHTFMYYLFYQMSLGKSPTWKKSMTSAQIIQFVWGVTSFWAVPYVCEYDLFSFEGHMMVFWVNQAVLFSLLLLFLDFFRRSYSRKSGDKAEPRGKTVAPKETKKVTETNGTPGG